MRNLVQLVWTLSLPNADLYKLQPAFVAYSMLIVVFNENNGSLSSFKIFIFLQKLWVTRFWKIQILQYFEKMEFPRSQSMQIFVYACIK